MSHADPPSQPVPPPVCSLSELQTALAAPIHLVIEVNGQSRTLALARLNARQRAKVDDLFNLVENRSSRVLPPVLRDKAGHPQPDEQDPEYQKRLAHLRRQARAQAALMALPELAAGAAAAGGLADPWADPERAMDWVETQLPETLLESIYLRLITDGIEIRLADRVSFT